MKQPNKSQDSARNTVNLLAKKVKADLDSLMIQSKVPYLNMVDAYRSTLPLAQDTLSIKRNIHTEGLSAFFPFSSPFLDIDPEGILIGLNKNKLPYIKDIFKLTNANGIVLATSGAGKSYFTKLLISRQFMNGSDVIIIDPQGEYLSLTEHYKGQIVTISRTSETIINPLDLMDHDYLEKRLSLMDLFKILFVDLSEPQKAILDKAVDETYGRAKITRDSWKNKKAPKLSDLYAVLLSHQRQAHAIEKTSYQALLNRLGMYTDKGVFSFLNRETNIKFSSNFVCFNIGAMPKQVKPVVMYLVLDFVYLRMKKSLRRKVLVIDEAWAMLQTAEESSYVFEIVKTCRKYNLGLLMITQDVADLLASRAGHAVLANTSYTFLLRQKPAIVHSVVKTFNLSTAERDYLVSAEKGQGIILLENEHQEITVIASPQEHDLITTNPDEIVRKVNPVKVPVSSDDKITLDLSNDVFPVKGLSIEEQIFLGNSGYVLGSFHNLTKGRQKEYYVRKRSSESPQHVFYVDLLYNAICEYTDAVKKFQTERPDIVFKNKHGADIAIEVETGYKVKAPTKKKYHNLKFEMLKEKYGDRCYIFLCLRVLKDSYLRHGIPLLFRLGIGEFLRSQLV